MLGVDETEDTRRTTRHTHGALLRVNFCCERVGEGDRENRRGVLPFPSLLSPMYKRYKEGADRGERIQRGKKFFFYCFSVVSTSYTTLKCYRVPSRHFVFGLYIIYKLNRKERKDKEENISNNQPASYNPPHRSCHVSLVFPLYISPVYLSLSHLYSLSYLVYLENWNILVDLRLHSLADALGNPHDVADLLLAELDVCIKDGIPKLGIECRTYRNQKRIYS